MWTCKLTVSMSKHSCSLSMSNSPGVIGGSGDWHDRGVVLALELKYQQATLLRWASQQDFTAAKRFQFKLAEAEWNMNSPHFWDGDQGGWDVWMHWKCNTGILILNYTPESLPADTDAVKMTWVLSYLCWAGCCKGARRPRLWECRGRGTWAGFQGQPRPRSLCSLEWCRRTGARWAGFWCKAPQSWTSLHLEDKVTVSKAELVWTKSRLKVFYTLFHCHTVCWWWFTWQRETSPLSPRSTQVKVMPPRWLSLKRNRKVPDSLSFSRARSISLLTNPMM